MKSEVPRMGLIKGTVRLAAGEKGKFDAYAMKRVAAGAHIPTLTFEPAKRPDDSSDCKRCSFLP